MLNIALVYETRFQKTLHEAYVHLARIYEDNRDQARHMLNNIYQYRGELRQILVEIEQKTGVLTDK